MCNFNQDLVCISKINLSETHIPNQKIGFAPMSRFALSAWLRWSGQTCNYTKSS